MGKTFTREESLAIRRQRVQETFKLDPDVIITLKGKKYTLEMNNYAVKEVLRDTGVNLMRDGLSRDSMVDPHIVGSILFRSMQLHHPDLTQDDVDKLYTLRHYSYVLDTLRQVVDLFMPDMSDIIVADVAREGTDGKIEDPT